MEQVILPLETRQCPQCGASAFKARRAGRGGSWGGQGIRYLYRCDDCGYGEMIESQAIRNSMSVSGYFLLALGALMFFLLDAPGNGIVAVLLVGLAASAIWYGRFDLERRAPVVAVSEGEGQSVPIEQTLFVSDEDAAISAVRNRYAAYLIYGIAALTLIYCVLELIGSQ